MLASAHAELLEASGQSDQAIKCYEDFVTRSPCSLGFILLQRVVRRKKGIDAARKIFSQARKCLISPDKEENVNKVDNIQKENDDDADELQTLVCNIDTPKTQTNEEGIKTVSGISLTKRDKLFRTSNLLILFLITRAL